MVFHNGEKWWESLAQVVCGNEGGSKEGEILGNNSLS